MSLTLSANWSDTTLSKPAGLAMLPSTGFYLISDATRSIILIAQTSGDVDPAIVAGNELLSTLQTSSLDGFGTSALFTNPSGLCVTSSSAGAETHVYVSDTGSNLIRRIALSETELSAAAKDGDLSKVSINAQVTTVAGGLRGHLDAVGTLAQFNHPSGAPFPPRFCLILILGF